MNQRAAKLASRTWYGVVLLTGLVSWLTLGIQPQVKVNLTTWPWGLVFPLLAIAGLVGVVFELRKRGERVASPKH